MYWIRACLLYTSLFLEKIKEDNELVPSFNTFYEFVQGEFSGILEEKHYREKDFDLTNFLNVVAPYYRGGEYDYLLNSDEQLDLLNKRFVVFEIEDVYKRQVLEKYYQSLKSSGHGIPFYYPVQLCLLPEH